MTSDPRAFFALDIGAATTSAALIGRVAGRWRLFGSVAFPADVPTDSVLGVLVDRFIEADPELAERIGAVPDVIETWPRLEARSSKAGTLATLAVSERALGPLKSAAERSGWRVRAGSAEQLDPLAMSALVLDAEVDAVLVGAGEPPGADERTSLGDLAALVAAAAVRRPELTVILAGGMAEQAPRFESPAERHGEILLGPAATAGSVPGAALRELLDRARARPDDSRLAFVRGVEALSSTIDRRVEAVELGLNGAVRVHAAPGRGDDVAYLHWSVLAGAGLVPVEPDESSVDRVLAWSTVQFDRHRMRDRLRDLRLSPWGDAAGDGARLRLSTARAALGRLVAGTPEFASLAPPDLIVISGGAWAVAPGPAIALAAADVIRRPGAVQLAFDHARLLGPLGMIEEPAERRTLVADLAGDLLVPLGSVVMPQGMRAGRAGGRLVVHGPDGSTELDLVPGGLELVDLPPGEKAVAEFQFRDTVRLGTRGRHFAVEVAGGLGGLLVDLRDVPLRLPDRADRRRELLAAWQDALWAGGEV